MFRRLERFKEQLRKETISPDTVLESLQGWNAYAMHANTYKLRRAITNKTIELIQH
jgi:hypothetical protein